MKKGKNTPLLFAFALPMTQQKIYYRSFQQCCHSAVIRQPSVYAFRHLLAFVVIVLFAKQKNSCIESLPSVIRVLSRVLVQHYDGNV